MINWLQNTGNIVHHDYNVYLEANKRNIITTYSYYNLIRKKIKSIPITLSVHF
jgi:hypothetical protein